VIYCCGSVSCIYGSYPTDFEMVLYELQRPDDLEAGFLHSLVNSLYTAQVEFNAHISCEGDTIDQSSYVDYGYRITFLVTRLKR